ncbi:hypothetical protein KPH14_006265 [Odynerus spinipes]|uniref:DDE-1 domain-containing protein n=1 Tax=Odynerus spinipes TaxID=1348599 RepID=A0AAD9VJP5_9HYME|nr:hypothetical protein KPH14_006265 [Odynerus spinipes]
MKNELLNGAPAGTIAVCHPSGWMQQHIFIEWIRHFISCVRPKKEDPILLILDGHATHTKNLDAIELARENGIIMLCLPPYCTHRMQPLDVSFMGPLSTFYSQEVKLWLRNHPGRTATQFQMASLFGSAYEIRAATMQNATFAFKKTGIYPYNPNVSTDVDFAPSKTTKRHQVPSATQVTGSTEESSTSLTIPQEPISVAGPVRDKKPSPKSSTFKRSRLGTSTPP